MTTDERMEKMERQLARVRWFNRCLIACIVLSLVVGVPFLVAWSGRKQIRANSFVVVDENGKPRALLSVREDGPSLELFNENGASRAELLLSNDVPSLLLWDQNGNHRVGLFGDKDVVGLQLSDENGKLRAGLTLNKDGPVLGLLDENGKPIWLVP